MKRIAVLVDVSNVYYCIGKRYNGKKLDYKKYYDYVESIGEICIAKAFGAQLDDQAQSFIYCLNEIGFEALYKTPKTYHNKKKLTRKADCDVDQAITIVDIVLNGAADLIILGTADGDLVPVVEWAQNKGIDVVVIACGISRDLKDAASKWIEIPESLLEG